MKLRFSLMTLFLILTATCAIAGVCAGFPQHHITVFSVCLHMVPTVIVSLAMVAFAKNRPAVLCGCIIGAIFGGLLPPFLYVSVNFSTPIWKMLLFSIVTKAMPPAVGALIGGATVMICNPSSKEP